MKILHVINTMEIGGAQRLIADLLPILAQNIGDKVSLLIFKTMDKNGLTDQLKESRVQIISTNTDKNYSLKTVLPLWRAVKQYDIVHFHCTPALYTAALLPFFHKAKFVYTEHSTSSRLRQYRWMKPIEKWVYNRMDKIISISAEAETALREWIGLNNRDKFVVIPNGINISNFINECKTPKRNLIMVSRFVPAKDQKTVIESLQYVEDSFLKLIFVGDGETMEECKNLAMKMSLSDRVDFLGSRSNIPELLSESYIGIQSSNWEGFGLTAVEIMASGKPVIASDVEGLRQVVEGAGLIFERGNARALAKNINALLSDDFYYNCVAEKCKLRAQKYDIRKTAFAYIDVYKSLL